MTALTILFGVILIIAFSWIISGCSDEKYTNNKKLYSLSSKQICYVGDNELFIYEFDGMDWQIIDRLGISDTGFDEQLNGK